MNIQYTHPLSNEKRGQLNNTLFFLLYRYIPLQKYTVPKNEKLRYRLGLTERPQCPLGHEGQRSGDDTSAPSPVQSVRARTGRGQCVCMCVCVCVCMYVCVCGVLLFGLSTLTDRIRRWLLSKTKRRKCVCVFVCFCVCPCLAESHRAWHGIFYTVRLASRWLAFDTATGGVHVMTIQETFFFSLSSPVTWSFSFPVFTSLSRLCELCFCIHSVGLMSPK